MVQVAEYKKTEVSTANNIRIISMLYDGAVNFVRIARNRLEQKDVAGKALYIAKATAIVAELSSSLNMEAGGEIARNLKRLYDYVLDRLIVANIKNDPDAFDNAEKILDILRSAWKEIEGREAIALNMPVSKASDRLAAGLRV